MRIVQPIVVVPEGYGAEEHEHALRGVKAHIEEFWETTNRPDLMVYWKRPLIPHCPENGEYFGLSTDLRSDDTVWRRAKQWIKAKGYAEDIAQQHEVPPEEVFFVIFLKDYNYRLVDTEIEMQSWWGWGSIGDEGVTLRVAVVDLDLVDDLAGATLEALDTKANDAVAVIQHEIGHMFGWWHIGDAPSLMREWWYYPIVNLPKEKAT